MINEISLHRPFAFNLERTARLEAEGVEPVREAPRARELAEGIRDKSLTSLDSYPPKSGVEQDGASKSAMSGIRDWFREL